MVCSSIFYPDGFLSISFERSGPTRLQFRRTFARKQLNRKSKLIGRIMYDETSRMKSRTVIVAIDHCDTPR